MLQLLYQSPAASVITSLSKLEELNQRVDVFVNSHNPETVALITCKSSQSCNRGELEGKEMVWELRSHSSQKAHRETGWHNSDAKG